MRKVVVALLLSGLALLAGCDVDAHAAGELHPVSRQPATPPVGHVFVVNLENKSYGQTFGPGTDAPYLSRILAGKGALLTRYYATAHESLPNYVAQISGQGPDRDTQHDCARFTPFVETGVAAPGQAVGRGCVYPPSVRTLAGQLSSHGRTWRGYLEAMGAPCRHPGLGRLDPTATSRLRDQYTVRTNPFVYFRSIGAAACRRDVVDLSRLRTDLRSVATTRSLSYITPDLCDQGHDNPCVDGSPGGLVRADAWLRRYVPLILGSPAYRADGLLVVTFDEAEKGRPGRTAACCGEGPGPDARLPGVKGPGGGRVGAVVLSPFVRPGTRSARPYNHYSLLRTIETIFGLPALGYAADVRGFGPDVWD